MKEDTTKKQNTQPLRDSAKIMVDWINSIRGLPAADFRAIVLAAVDYECYNRQADLSKENDQVKLAWSFIAPQIKRMSDHYAEIAARNRVNGNKGGRPRKANDESSEEEPPNPQNPNGFSDNPKKPSGLWENPKNPIIEENRIEDKIKENKSQEKAREGKASAPFEEGAYSPSSLMNSFNFISPSLASSFSRWIQHLSRKDHDKLMPKTPDEYKAQYDRLVNLSEKDPYTAKLIVEDCIKKDYAKLFNNLNPKYRAIREANRRDLIAAGLDPDEEPTTYGSDHEF